MLRTGSKDPIWLASAFLILPTTIEILGVSGIRTLSHSSSWTSLSDHRYRGEAVQYYSFNIHLIFTSNILFITSYNTFETTSISILGYLWKPMHFVSRTNIFLWKGLDLMDMSPPWHRIHFLLSIFQGYNVFRYIFIPEVHKARFHPKIGTTKKPRIFILIQAFLFRGYSESL